jgi:hypothetical protein
LLKDRSPQTLRRERRRRRRGDCFQKLGLAAVSLVLAPEGRVTFDPFAQRFRLGAFQLAVGQG